MGLDFGTWDCNETRSFFWVEFVVIFFFDRTREVGINGGGNES